MSTPTVHTFTDLTSGEVYDQAQVDRSIGNGDVLVVPREGVVGILVDAWPVAITSSAGAFHTLEPHADWSTIRSISPERNPGVDFRRSYEAATEVCRHQGYRESSPELEGATASPRM